MWLQNHQILSKLLWLLTLDLVLCDKIVFRTDNLVQIKNVNHTQLECQGNLCNFLTEITCVEENGDIKPNSCLITDKNSSYFNRSITEEKVICADDHKSIKDECYLAISSKNIKKTSKITPDLITNLLDKELMNTLAKENQQFIKEQNKKASKTPIRDPFDNPFDEDFERGQRQSRYIMIGLIIIFALVFILMLTAICKGCCTEGGLDPCVSCREEPVISESARRRISFPRNNYAISTANTLQQTGTIQPTYNIPQSNPNYNSTFNNPVDKQANNFADPPPAYSSLNIGQTNQGNVNYGYTPVNQPPNFQNQRPNNQGYMPNPSAPSAPEKF